MHHFIYPKSDTYITNDSRLYVKNFGGDSSLVLSCIDGENRIRGTTASISVNGCDGEFYNVTPTSSYIVTTCNEYYVTVANFTGFLYGSGSGMATFITGAVINSCTSCSNFVFSTLTVEGTASAPSGYTASISASNGTAPYTYTIVSGSLPPGLTLNSSTGYINGIPTIPGRYPFIIYTIDSNYCLNYVYYSIYVWPENYWELI
jgi:hypothetical protein